MFNDVERVKIVVEALAEFAHAEVELLFTGVAEGRMADVVSQGQRFGKIGIQIQSAGNGARHLRDFESVSEAIAEVIGVAGGEDLRFGFEAAEGARMDDAVAVAGVIVAVRMLRLGVATAASAAHVHGVGCEHSLRLF